MATNLVGYDSSGATPKSKAARLRSLLSAPSLSFIMEAHNALSAKIVEEAGFEGIWASGLSMSTALGVRDTNEASWTQVLEQLEFMSDATSIPILVDGDTGYGNFNNVRRLVKKLCQRGIAGVCIEDKLFPKTNSFIGEGQPLADTAEFCGRIKAGKDSQTDEDFQLVARVEALISGLGMEEALRRAEAYHEAGADAILIHSKKSSAEEVVRFSEEWADRAPLVIVPTKYYATPTQTFRRAGFSMVIWANHNLRAAISAMREVCDRIKAEESLSGVENTVASLGDVFSLVGQSELADAEARYLATAQGGPRAIVLAASRGERLGPLTKSRPKCMIDIRGKPLLHRLVSTLNGGGIRDVTVVRGYEKDTIDLASIETIDNADYATTGEAMSLACASDRLDRACLISYGDVLFRPHILDRLLELQDDIAVVVDARWHGSSDGNQDRKVDAVRCSRPFTGEYLDEGLVRLTDIGHGPDFGKSQGEFIGLVKLSDEGAQEVGRELETMKLEGVLGDADLPSLLARLIARDVPIGVLYITGDWLDVDDAFDLAKARNLN